MLKKIFKNGLIALISFYIIFIISLPREGLWFKFEEMLNSQKTIIADETLSDGIVSLTVEHGEVITSGMSVANFDRGEITALLFYNRIYINNLNIGEDLKQFGNIYLDNLIIEQSIIQPYKIILNGVGSVGEFKGRVNIKERTVDILLFPSEQFKKMRGIMKHFKKYEQGGYIYNGKF